MALRLLWCAFLSAVASSLLRGQEFEEIDANSIYLVTARLAQERRFELYAVHANNYSAFGDSALLKSCPFQLYFGFSTSKSHFTVAGTYLFQQCAVRVRIFRESTKRLVQSYDSVKLGHSHIGVILPTGFRKRTFSYFQYENNVLWDSAFVAVFRPGFVQYSMNSRFTISPVRDMSFETLAGFHYLDTVAVFSSAFTPTKLYVTLNHVLWMESGLLTDTPEDRTFEISDNYILENGKISAHLQNRFPYELGLIASSRNRARVIPYERCGNSVTLLYDGQSFTFGRKPGYLAQEKLEQIHFGNENKRLQSRRLSDFGWSSPFTIDYDVSNRFKTIALVSFQFVGIRYIPTNTTRIRIACSQ